MADFGDDVKTKEKNSLGNESLNNRSSFSGNSGNRGSISASKFEPVKVTALLEGDSDDEDSDDKNRSSNDEGASDVDEGQPLPRNGDIEFKPQSTQIDTALSSKIGATDSQLEIVTEESERSNNSRESIKNLLDHCTSSTSYSSTIHAVTTTVAMTTTTTTSSNYNHQLFDKQQIRTYSQCNASSTSRELFHENNENKLSIGKSFVTGFPSDFASADLNPKNIKTIENTDGITPFVQSKAVASSTGQKCRSQTVDNTIGRKSESNISSSSIYSNRVQANMKYEAPDSLHPSHDRYMHSLPSSKYDSGGVPTSQSDLLPLSSNYSSVETPHKHNPVPGSMRPTPSVSHRNIFQTPQNKMQGNFLSNQNHAPTPGTIFSHWSQNNMMHTPLQHKISDSQTPGKAILSKHEPVWYKNKETKGVRRPLAETTGSEHRILTEKSLHGLKIHDPVENLNRPPLESIGENAPIPRIINQESQENRYPSVMDSATKKDGLRQQQQKMSEHIEENRHNNQEMISKPTDMEKLRKTYNNPSGIQNEINIQASVPSSIIKKPNHGKTIKVKDREYMILGDLGKGMSGDVIRVQDLTNFELRAIKCVDLSRMDKDTAQNCVQEIAMLGKLQAPCIIHMFDYEIRNKMIHVVMEMGDTDFSKLLKSITAEKRLPLTMILYYWTEMLTAVKHIHDNGVIHSDLKPANFLLVRGRLKLIDFGIASSLNADMTSVVKNSTVGTLNYISPEALMDVGESTNQNSTYKINYKSDVWSLGCILYSLVFGHTPFQHIRQQWAKINAITNPHNKISFTQSPNSEPIPSVLIDVMQRCLQHDPKARPTVAQLLEVRYVPIGKQNPISHNIPPNILLKIKSALNEDELRQFIEAMDQKQGYS